MTHTDGQIERAAKAIHAVDAALPQDVADEYWGSFRWPDMDRYKSMARAALAAADAPGEGLQTEVATWARETFGPNYGFNDLRKLFNEMEELKRAALVYGAESQAMSDPEPTAVANEAADVMHMLFQLAHNLGFDLLEQTRKKFEINKQRVWQAQSDGTYQHVKEATDAS